MAAGMSASVSPGAQNGRVQAVKMSSLVNEPSANLAGPRMLRAQIAETEQVVDTALALKR
jgi:hypothetical protein